MDALFSCRNCIQDCSQSLRIGNGIGFCVKHESMILKPESTTCKYLHRKDLPHFVVDEGIREHAAEFAGFSSLVGLEDHRSLDPIAYSERFAWKKRSFDPVIQALAQYWKTKPVWIFIQSFSGGLDGRRALVHAALVRRYMEQCGNWSSSVRLVLALIQELELTPSFDPASLVLAKGEDPAKACEDAVWDVVFSRIACLQEYGFHAGLENLMWLTDELNGSLCDLDWSGARSDILRKKREWTEQIISHAEHSGKFFGEPTRYAVHEETDEYGSPPWPSDEPGGSGPAPAQG
jgi:hypothetical protein